MTGAVLAVDLGKTGCRAVLHRAGVASTADGPGAPGLAFAGGVEAAVAAILAVAGPLRAGPAHVCVGAAGALSAPGVSDALAHRLLAALAAASVAVTSDAVTTHAGALAGAAGIVLAIGTGAVATAVAPGGRFVRVDGWGPWLGDEGSGAAIGRAGLRAVMRAEDGRGPATSLTAAAEACFATGAASLPAYLGTHPSPVREAARFAGPVAAAAADGDAVAAAILDAAAQDLADTVRAAVARSGLPSPVPFAVVGGLLRIGPALADRLHAAVATLALARVPACGTALDGARLLATATDTLHEPQVRRLRAAPAGPARCPGT